MTAPKIYDDWYVIERSTKKNNKKSKATTTACVTICRWSYRLAVLGSIITGYFYDEIIGSAMLMTLLLMSIAYDRISE